MPLQQRTRHGHHLELLRFLHDLLWGCPMLHDPDQARVPMLLPYGRNARDRDPDDYSIHALCAVCRVPAHLSNLRQRGTYRRIRQHSLQQLRDFVPANLGIVHARQSDPICDRESAMSLRLSRIRAWMLCPLALRRSIGGAMPPSARLSSILCSTAALYQFQHRAVLCWPDPGPQQSWVCPLLR